MATKTQGTTMTVETARAATKAISGITAASPPVVTATSHGYSNGDIIYLDNIVGMVQLNKRAFIAANIATNTFELKGMDSTTYTAYASGGDSYKTTQTAIGTVSGIPNLFDGTAETIDVTHLLSTAKEKLQALPDFGGASFELILDNTNTGQAALRSAKAAQAAKVFTIQDVAGTPKKACFSAFVNSFKITAPQNEAWRATVDLAFEAEPTYFA